MPSFFLKNDALWARDVDVKRLARVIRKLQLTPDGKPVLSMPEALDVACVALGARDHFDALRRSRDPDVTNWTEEQVRAEMKRRAISFGQPFPRGLPQRFGADWKSSVQVLFSDALNARVPGQLEFVALIGGAGSGKTLLAEHECANRGGVVIDTAFAWMATPNDSMFLEHFRDGAILVQDQSTALMPDDKRSGFGPLWEQLPVAQRTLKHYEDLRRRPRHMLFGDDNAFNDPVRNWVREHPAVALVSSFATREDVINALHVGVRIKPVGEQWQTASAPLNWRVAHVVDLDAMRFYSVEGPGLAMEQGRHNVPLSAAAG